MKLSDFSYNLPKTAIAKNNKLFLEPIGNMLEEAEHIRRHTYNKKSFALKLNDMQDVKGIIPPELDLLLREKLL